MTAPLPLSRTYDWLAIISLATSLAITFYFYDLVPDRIPSHFDASGQPDNWSGKRMLWFLPGMGLFMYVFLGLMGMVSANANSNWSSIQPKPGSEAIVKALNLQMMGGLRAIILLLFTYLSWGTIQIAMEKAEGLWGGALPLFLVLLFGYVGYYVYESMKHSK